MRSTLSPEVLEGAEKLYGQYDASFQTGPEYISTYESDKALFEGLLSLPSVEIKNALLKLFSEYKSDNPKNQYPSEPITTSNLKVLFDVPEELKAVRNYNDSWLADYFGFVLTWMDDELEIPAY